ncbi:hypothetical protein WJX72_006879 [[Myrmecia] bisecta]|uniref:Uncharacterized protein n=1 Tax=[Myrmecia] bisecta TaxID=41462 RepID=A0AAW1QSE5_9CHLO
MMASSSPSAAQQTKPAAQGLMIPSLPLPWPLPRRTSAGGAGGGAGRRPPPQAEPGVSAEDHGARHVPTGDGAARMEQGHLHGRLQEGGGVAECREAPA